MPKRVSCPELTAELDQLAKLIETIDSLKLASDLAYCLHVVRDEFGKHASRKGTPLSAAPAAKKVKPKRDPLEARGEDSSMTKEELEDFERFLKEPPTQAEAELEKLLKDLAKVRRGDKGDK